MAGSFFQFSAGGWSFLKGYKLWEGKEEESAGSILGIPVENLPFGNQKEDKKGPREDGLYVWVWGRSAGGCFPALKRYGRLSAPR